MKLKLYKVQVIYRQGTDSLAQIFVSEKQNSLQSFRVHFNLISLLATPTVVTLEEIKAETLKYNIIGQVSTKQGVVSWGKVHANLK